MGILETIRGPGDLRDLCEEQLRGLATEIRESLIAHVSRTGGHLGSNLGVVELTIALHRIFASPKDRILWDTGHQAYVHKILTGRLPGFKSLRQKGGLSGYPAQAESEHDVIENSHASTSLSYADGLTKGYSVLGVEGRSVVVVIGDGALTGGMAWEALNNIAAARNRSLIIVVNDNGRSYAPTTGGLAEHLAKLRTSSRRERSPDAAERVKEGQEEVTAPQVMFEELGLKYVGPVNGHDIAEIEFALRRAASYGEPVVVHCITRKGQGYAHAENGQSDCFHAIGTFDAGTGKPLPACEPTWTETFSDEIVRIGEERGDVVAVTAAMLKPTGLGEFARKFPDRTFDVGIAEQHAVTSAVGLVMAGLRPVVAIYATFMNRAFDQVMMDAALHRSPVVFVLDRAGVTGDDGPSHNGMWDLSMLQMVPGLRIAAPRDGKTLRASLRGAIAACDGPSVIRYPKGPVGPDIPAVDNIDGVDILRYDSRPDVLIVAVGAMARLCLDVAGKLAADGIGVDVVDPGWLSPVNKVIAELAEGYQLVATVEDNLRVGGFGAALAMDFSERGVSVPLVSFGLPKAFLSHGKRSEVLAQCGLTCDDIALEVQSRLDAQNFGLTL